jgi:hypothetical protein
LFGERQAVETTVVSSGCIPERIGYRSPLSQAMMLPSASIVQDSGKFPPEWVQAHALMQAHDASVAQAGGMGMHHC